MNFVYRLNLNEIDKSKSFSSWIYRITHNEAMNLIKKCKKEISILVVGTPIIGWRPTVKMQAFLDKLLRLDGIKATTFDTRVKLFIHGDAMGKVADRLKNSGAKIIVSPMPFYVAGPQQKPYLLDGEIEKAQRWAKEIAETFYRIDSLGIS